MFGIFWGPKPLMSRPVFCFGLQLSPASVGAGPPEPEDQAHRVSDGYSEEGCDVHRGEARAGVGSHGGGWGANLSPPRSPKMMSSSSAARPAETS